MNSLANAKYKEPSANDVGHQYNFQHLVLVTKYRYKMFKNPKTVGIMLTRFITQWKDIGVKKRNNAWGKDV